MIDYRLVILLFLAFAFTFSAVQPIAIQKSSVYFVDFDYNKVFNLTVVSSEVCSQDTSVRYPSPALAL